MGTADQLMRLALLAGLCLLTAPVFTTPWRRQVIAGAVLTAVGLVGMMAT